MTGRHLEASVRFKRMQRALIPRHPSCGLSLLHLTANRLVI